MEVIIIYPVFNVISDEIEDSLPPPPTPTMMEDTVSDSSQYDDDLPPPPPPAASLLLSSTPVTKINYLTAVTPKPYKSPFSSPSLVPAPASAIPTVSPAAASLALSRPSTFGRASYSPVRSPLSSKIANFALTDTSKPSNIQAELEEAATAGKSSREPSPPHGTSHQDQDQATVSDSDVGQDKKTATDQMSSREEVALSEGPCTLEKEDVHTVNTFKMKDAETDSANNDYVNVIPCPKSSHTSGGSTPEKKTSLSEIEFNSNPTDLGSSIEASSKAKVESPWSVSDNHAEKRILGVGGFSMKLSETGNQDIDLKGRATRSSSTNSDSTSLPPSPKISFSGSSSSSSSKSLAKMILNGKNSEDKPHEPPATAIADIKDSTSDNYMETLRKENDFEGDDYYKDPAKLVPLTFRRSDGSETDDDNAVIPAKKEVKSPEKIKTVTFSLPEPESFNNNNNIIKNNITSNSISGYQLVRAEPYLEGDATARSLKGPGSSKSIAKMILDKKSADNSMDDANENKVPPSPSSGKKTRPDNITGSSSAKSKAIADMSNYVKSPPSPSLGRRARMENITESKTAAPTSSSRAKSPVDNNDDVQTLPSPSYGRRTRPENSTESKNTPTPPSHARSKVITNNNNDVRTPPIFSISSYKSEIYKKVSIDLKTKILYSPESCSYCMMDIGADGVTAADKMYHRHCFRCHQCREQLMVK